MVTLSLQIKHSSTLFSTQVQTPTTSIFYPRTKQIIHLKKKTLNNNSHSITPWKCIKKRSTYKRYLRSRRSKYLSSKYHLHKDITIACKKTTITLYSIIWTWLHSTIHTSHARYHTFFIKKNQWIKENSTNEM